MNRRNVVRTPLSVASHGSGKHSRENVKTGAATNVSGESNAMTSAMASISQWRSSGAITRSWCQLRRVAAMRRERRRWPPSAVAGRISRGWPHFMSADFWSFAIVMPVGRAQPLVMDLAMREIIEDVVDPDDQPLQVF